MQNFLDFQYFLKGSYFYLPFLGYRKKQKIIQKRLKGED